jgi:ornithine carbamoyltransferase
MTKSTTTISLVTTLQEKHNPVKSLHNPVHLLTGEELTAKQIKNILYQALILKNTRSPTALRTELQGYHLALLFDKPSLRTRFSFTLAMRELGGNVIESIESTRKVEMPEDQARVLSGYCHAIMIRTHKDSILERMSQVAKIPIINGLSNLHHPCQIFADLLTLLEVFGSFQKLTLCYIGDGNNILHSLLLMAPQMGVNIHYCCPPTREPNEAILARSFARLKENTAKIQSFSDPKQAVRGAHAVYTDVWTSMGSEDRSAEHLFSGYQVNEALMQCTGLESIFMHCLPMERGKEVSETLPDLPLSVIFRQSENRLHAQKALLIHLLKR